METFLKYLEFELKPQRKQFPYVRTLYERALAVHCLVPTLWTDYNTAVLAMVRDKLLFTDNRPKKIP